MRTFEIFLLVILAANLVFLFLPKPKRAAWILGLPGLALVAICLQLLLEKFRWQMLPAYGLTLWFLLLGLFQTITRRNTNPLPRGILFGSIIGVVILPLAIALPALVPIFVLPKPDGAYAVGTTYLDLVDERRSEPFTPDDRDHREMAVQVWYPAQTIPGAAPAPYFRNVAAVRSVIADLAEMQALPLPKFALDHLSLVQTHASLDVPVADSVSPFPVLLFSHGYLAWNSQNTAQMEHLASHGYIVFSIGHPYESLVASFNDGRIIRADSRVVNTFLDSHRLINRWASEETWVADIRFVMDVLQEFNTGMRGSLFAGKMDLDHIGIFGHSFGGWTAAQVCTIDERCKAGISLDGGFTRPYPRGPFMYMFREGIETDGLVTSLYLNRSTSVIVIEGSKHLNFGDFSLYSPLLKLSNSDLWGLGAINGRRMIQILNTYTLAFFDDYLKDGPAFSPESLAVNFPEAKLIWSAP